MPRAALGQPFTTWSLATLVAYLAEHRRLEVSTETVRRVLRAAGITWQARKTWKASRAPDLAVKMARILALYDDPPADGRVLCVMRSARSTCNPGPGKGWFRAGQPADGERPTPAPRDPADVRRAGPLPPDSCSTGSATPSAPREFLGFCKQLLHRFPAGRIYLVCDNYGAHQKAEVLTWCANHDIELVFTPSNASWLNWIECESPRCATSSSTAATTPPTPPQEQAMARYIRCANRHAKPKRHYAVNPKIRRPDYLPQRCVTRHQVSRRSPFMALQALRSHLLRSIVDTVVRNGREEIGVTVRPADLRCVHCASGTTANDRVSGSPSYQTR